MTEEHNYQELRLVTAIANLKIYYLKEQLHLQQEITALLRRIKETERK